MQELIKTRCSTGHLIITDTQIKTIGNRMQVMNRSTLTGVDDQRKAVPLFGFGEGAHLIFHGQGGERLHAELMRPKYAKQIMRMLGY